MGWCVVVFMIMIGFSLLDYCVAFEQLLWFMVPYFCVIGIFVGLLSMLFGVGGGLVIVPGVDLFLLHMGFTASLSMKMAVATSLMTIFFSTLNVLYKQNKNGVVLWPLVFKFLPFVILGALVGVLISSMISGVYLKFLFVMFLAFIIVYSFFKKDFESSYQLHDFRMPHLLNRAVIGFFVGSLSVLIGVGGNIMLMPYLRYFKLPMKNATAFTVALMPFLAMIASVIYVIDGLRVTEVLPPYSLGYVSVPAVLLIFSGSFLGAMFGQRLLKHLTDKIQARAYLIFLMLVFLLMLL